MFTRSQLVGSLSLPKLKVEADSDALSTRCITESFIPSITKHGEILASAGPKFGTRAPLSRWKSVRILWISEAVRRTYGL
jgi:hypothetical protein